MNKNLEILNNWDNTISKYKKLSFDEALELYKNGDINNLINGTLYVVSKFIRSNGLTYLNSTIYDMDDIICISNEFWVEKIKSGILFHVDNFGKIFNFEYFNKLYEGLGIIKYSISEDTSVDINYFADLLFDYIKYKEKNENFDYLNFIDKIKSDRKYKWFIYKIERFGSEINFSELFDAIIESFELEGDFNLSKTKLDKLKYILLNNGFEYLRDNIYKYFVDPFEKFIREYSNEQIRNYILNCEVLSDMQKDIINERFGLEDGKPKTLDEIGQRFGVTGERIRQNEARALRKLKINMKEIKNLI